MKIMDNFVFQQEKNSLLKGLFYRHSCNSFDSIHFVISSKLSCMYQLQISMPYFGAIWNNFKVLETTPSLISPKDYMVNNILWWRPANISDRHSTNANLNLYVPINQADMQIIYRYIMFGMEIQSQDWYFFANTAPKHDISV